MTATHYVVLVDAGSMDCEALLVTCKVKEALMAVAALATVAPALSTSIYIDGLRRVLTITNGVWRVPTSDPAPEARAHTSPAGAQSSRESGQFAFGAGR